MNAYAETYLNDAMNNLGDMLDYAVNDCGYEAKDFWDYFTNSGVAKSFEIGNPRYVAGFSGVELVSEVLLRTTRSQPNAPMSVIIEKSPEYWGGWIMAYYQWYTNKRFSDFTKKGLTIDYVLSLYPTLHEADPSRFVSAIDNYIALNSETATGNLKRIRKANGITQKKLAEESGVALRMIQLYEQGYQDINKAQAISLARMAHVLGCSVDDLLE
ncbi:MAG: helix-turn-helix domain-containing protein [Lachnospiraceae bacterium]|nr:helix-turn-helix domain-containing protein [Lachnospiraceae bacterium]